MKELKTRIAEYHRQLKALAVFDYHGDSMKAYEEYCERYPNIYQECDDIGVKNELFLLTVYKPMMGLLSWIRGNGHFDIDAERLGNEYMVRDGEVIELLQYISPRHRRLLLDGFTFPTCAYTDISEGIIDGNLESLKRGVGKVDASGLYKKIKYLNELRYRIVPKTQSSMVVKMWNEALVTYTTERRWETELDDFSDLQDKDYEELLDSTKTMIRSCFVDEEDQYSAQEKAAIEKLMRENRLFRDYYNRIPRHREPIGKFKFEQISEPAKEIQRVNGNVILGVKGLAMWLGCGINTAQRIVNKKILQNRGILYYSGRGVRVRKDMLDDLLAREPEIFRNL